MDPQGRLLVPVWSLIGFIQVPIRLPLVPIQLPIRVSIQVPIQVLIQIPIQAPVLIPIQRFHSGSHLQQLSGCVAALIFHTERVSKTEYKNTEHQI